MIDGYLLDCTEGSTDVLLRDKAFIQSCSLDNKSRRSVRRLDKMLMRLQTELQLRQVEQTTHTLAPEVMTAHTVSD